jgi:WD40 repeat protein
LIEFRQLPLAEGGVDSVSFAPNGRRLGAGERSGIYSWDIESGGLEQTFTTDTAESRSLTWSVDGEALAASNTTGLEVWNANNGAPLANLDSYSEALNVLDWSPTGDALAVGTDDRVIDLFESRTGRLLHALQCSGGVSSIDFSPKGHELAAGLTGDAIEIWTADGSLSTTLQGVLSIGRIYVAFSPDSSWLLSNISTLNPQGEVWAAESLRIWQTHDWAPVQSWKIGDLVLVITLEAAPDGRLWQ